MRAVAEGKKTTFLLPDNKSISLLTSSVLHSLSLSLSLFLSLSPGLPGEEQATYGSKVLSPEMHPPFPKRFWVLGGLRGVECVSFPSPGNPVSLSLSLFPSPLFLPTDVVAQPLDLSLSPSSTPSSFFALVVRLVFPTRKQRGLGHQKFFFFKKKRKIKAKFAIYPDFFLSR